MKERTCSSLVGWSEDDGWIEVGEGMDYEPNDSAVAVKVVEDVLLRTREEER